jgi:hypothetical protein
VIASHYAEPVERVLAGAAQLHAVPSPEEIINLRPTGERFLMLDDSLGWAWGYAGAHGRVGYVRSGALAA